MPLRVLPLLRHTEDAQLHVLSPSRRAWRFYARVQIEPDPDEQLPHRLHQRRIIPHPFRGRRRHAHEGQFLIVDCYEPHRFSTDESCRDIWLHYDGPAARNMYEYIVERSGNIIDAGRSGHGLHEMHAIFDMLKAGRGAREAELSHHIDGVLASLASAGKSSGPHSDALNVIDRSLPYITAHLNDDLSLDSLATVFCIDKYYFSKRFKERTGTTPHQYILNARLERGKFLLHTTTLPVGAPSAPTAASTAKACSAPPLNAQTANPHRNIVQNYPSRSNPENPAKPKIS